MRAKTLSFEISHHAIKLDLWVKACLSCIVRSVPEILTFWVLTEPFMQKFHPSEKKSQKSIRTFLLVGFDNVALNLSV